jgi:hypothetical protein
MGGGCGGHDIHRKRTGRMLDVPSLCGMSILLSLLPRGDADDGVDSAVRLLLEMFVVAYSTYWC